HRPVPETARGGSVRVEAGHSKALCSLGKTAPGQVGRDILTTCAHDPADLGLGKGLPVGHVVARHGERGDLGKKVVGRGCSGHERGLLLSCRLYLRYEHTPRGQGKSCVLRAVSGTKRTGCRGAEHQTDRAVWSPRGTRTGFGTRRTDRELA